MKQEALPWMWAAPLLGLGVPDWNKRREWAERQYSWPLASWLWMQCNQSSPPPIFLPLWLACYDELCPPTVSWDKPFLCWVIFVGNSVTVTSNQYSPQESLCYRKRPAAQFCLPHLTAWWHPHICYSCRHRTSPENGTDEATGSWNFILQIKPVFIITTFGC